MRRNQPTAPLLFLALLHQSSAKFDPYALNGGLVSAVAGRDYVIIAADTRLTDGGYQIQSRRYLDGRIWAATDPHLSSSLHATSRPIFGSDGSLRIPRDESTGPVVSDLIGEETSDLSPANHTNTSTHYRLISNPFGLTMVGAAGCASDCEALKRVVRSELADRCSWARPASSSSSSAVSSASATTVATLLLHTLYSRRQFPYYSFCVLAGLDSETGTGQVHVYDAIGSHERVAVACAGTPGREMLQPILDRMFAAPRKAHGDDGNRSSGGSSLIRDGTALGASRQRVGSISLRPPVGTRVSCDSDEAVAMLLKAYRSVSEREIGTGDDLVICVLRRNAHGQGAITTASAKGTASECCVGSVEVMRFSLKKH